MAVAPEATTVGFIGLGVMGRSMARHILDAGYRLLVYTRTRATASELLSHGAEWCDTPAQLAQRADIVVTMVGYPADVTEVYLGESGVIEHARRGAYLIDMTTSSPRLACDLAKRAAARGCFALDAPVSGGDVGARNATLSVMVGGDADALAEVEPLLRVMAASVIREGGPGAGQRTKLANQIAIAGTMLGVCEALAFSERAGLDPQAVLDAIGGGAAGSWTMTNLAPRMLAGDFAPGFYVKHFVKDLRIALDEAHDMGFEGPALELALSLYEILASEGEADAGTQALYKLYQRQGGAS